MQSYRRRRRVMRAAVVIALTVLSVTAAAEALRVGGDSGTPMVPVALQLDELEASGPCSAGRWPVKTLTDSRASSVVATPSATTIAALGALPRPVPDLTDSTPRLPSETQVATVTGTLYVDHLEDDLDIHLVVLDPSNHAASMIAEFPDPRCTAKSTPAQRALMTRARNAYVEACGPASGDQGDYFLDGTAQVTGVKLFDTIVGQFGRAPNAIELHPVLGFKILGACRKLGGPTRFGLTSSIVEGSTLRGTVSWSASVTAGSSTVSSLAFLVDGSIVGTVRRSAGSGQLSVDSSRFVDGAHAFAVKATLADGSTTLLVNHVLTSNGVHATKPMLGTRPATVRPGDLVVISLHGFAARATIDAAATGAKGRQWASGSIAASGAGTATLRLPIPLAAPAGRYVVTACQSGCALVATGHFSVRR